MYYRGYSIKAQEKQNGEYTYTITRPDGTKHYEWTGYGSSTEFTISPRKERYGWLNMRTRFIKYTEDEVKQMIQNHIDRIIKKKAEDPNRVIRTF